MDSTVNNLANLADLSEPSILHETRHRYYNQQIYTHVGSDILLAVNPNRVLNLYNGKPKPETHF
jgi:myosin heavy subunit